MRSSHQWRLRVGASLIGLLLASPATGQVAATADQEQGIAAQATQVTPPSQPWAHENSDVPVDPAVRFGLLPNGIRYAIQHNATPAGKASLWLRIDAGSLAENDNQRGLAHFMEHMAFNGTEDIPENELIHQLQRLGLQFGADLNAATSFDQTFYRLDMPRNDAESIDTGLHVLRQQVSAATMDPKDIDEERGVIQGEDRLRNSPASIIGNKQLAILGAGTLLPRRMPIGDMEVIRTAPRERFVEYYSRYYRPSRATVIAVGDFDVDAMEAKIKAEFADWQPKAPDGPEPDLGKVAKHDLEAHTYVEATLPPKISINWIREPELKPDTLANRRDALIHGLAIAVLNRRLAERGRQDNPPFVDAQAVDGEVFRSLRLPSIGATFMPGKWQEALAEIEQAQRQFVQYGISQAELNREINSTRTRLEEAVKGQSTRDTVGLAARLASDVNERQVTASPETALQIFNAAVDGLTAEAVNAVTKKIFIGEGPVLTLTSADSVPGGDSALKAAYGASTKVAVAPVNAPEAKSWAYTDFGTPGQVVSVSKPDELGATTYVFANGVKLTVKHTDFDKNEIAVGLLTGIGERNFSPDKIDPRATAIGGLVPGGLGQMTLDEVSRALNGHVIGASLSTLGQRFYLAGSTRPEDLQLQMQYMAALMTDPAFRPNDFNKAMATAPSGWIIAQSSPGGVFGLKGTPLIAGDDQRVVKAPPEVTRDWRMEPLRDDLVRMLSQGPIHIVIAGDMAPEDAVQAVATTFGALPPRPAFNAPAPNADQRRFGKASAEPILFTHNGLKEQSLGTVTWPTTDLIGDNRKLARQLSVLRAVFALRVLDIIREKEGLAYSPGVSEEYSADYKGFGTMRASAATSPDKLPAFYAAIDAIVQDLRSKPVSADELKRARTPMIEHARQAQKSNGGWFRMMIGGAYAPSTLKDALTEISVYEAVTPAMIQKLARQYLVPEKAMRISVVPGEAAMDSNAMENAE